MSRRFSVESELNRIDSGLVNDAQKEWGTHVLWYRFDPDATEVDDLYDVGAARRWHPPLRIPVLWVVREEARDTFREEGKYGADQLQIAMAKTVFRDKLHWLDLKHDVETRWDDRVKFEGVVFRVVSFQLMGQLLDRDTILGLDLRKVRADQYFFDPDFAS